MTAEHDVDLKEWVGDWQAAPSDADSADEIRHYVKRRTGLLWSFAVADLVISAIALPVLAYIGLASTSDIERMAMLSLASITVATVMFGWWNRRGVLRSSATTMTDYVAISAERLRRMRMAWRIGWVVLIAEVIVFSIWINDRLYSGRIAGPGEEQFAWAWLAGFSLLAVFGLLKFGQWIARDADRFEALINELDVPSHRRVHQRRRKHAKQIRG